MLLLKQVVPQIGKDTTIKSGGVAFVKKAIQFLPIPYETCLEARFGEGWDIWLAGKG